MEAKAGKSQRKRLQRQLEFYLSESNLRQDKFLQQTMDEQGFVPVRVFLSFNKLKSLNATERMILDEAEKSAAIRVDRARCCIARRLCRLLARTTKQTTHTPGLSTYCFYRPRTVYIDSFSATDDHDSLRRTFAKFGKVNFVSLPRFPQSKKFKGFGFVEFSEQSAADEVAAKSSNTDLRGIRVMSKTRWIEMKKQLKRRLSCAEADADVAVGNDLNTGNSMNRSATTGKKKKKRRIPAVGGGHLHFGDDEGDEEGPTDSDGNGETTKKQKV
ncbi:Nucleotide-binding alpha-beta plait domain [Phytophthora cactorum]|nr:Nucleotide-binding alpha-beta plait domain [Phytophthora cactorum]